MARRRQRGSGEVYQEPCGSWAFRWREKGRRRYSGGHPSKQIAERALAHVKGELAVHRAGLPPDPRGFPPLATLADDWIERRELTHRSWEDDRGRWRNHLAPYLGHLRATDVDHAIIRRFVEEKLQELNSATVGACIRLLSTMFSDFCERPRDTGATANPVRTLPRSTRRLYRPTHDPKDTPFLEQLEDVRRVYRALLTATPRWARAARRPRPSRAPDPVYAAAYATGALSGMRTGEVLGLDWRDVDLDTRRIKVRQQVQDNELGPLKDDETRIAPVQGALLPILKSWKLRTGGTGLVFSPCQASGGRPGSGPRFIRPHTLHAHLRAALRACQLAEELTWYQVTRHTFASQWVLAGGSMEKLAAILGHSSTEVTKRYAHLRPELFRAEDHELLEVDLVRGDGQVVELEQPENGQPMASEARSDARVKRGKC